LNRQKAAGCPTFRRSNAIAATSMVIWGYGLLHQMAAVQGNSCFFLRMIRLCSICRHSSRCPSIPSISHSPIRVIVASPCTLASRCYPVAQFLVFVCLPAACFTAYKESDNCNQATLATTPFHLVCYFEVPFLASQVIGRKPLGLNCELPHLLILI